MIWHPFLPAYRFWHPFGNLEQGKQDDLTVNCAIVLVNERKYCVNVARQESSTLSGGLQKLVSIRISAAWDLVWPLPIVFLLWICLGG